MNFESHRSQECVDNKLVGQQFGNKTLRKGLSVVHMPPRGGALSNRHPFFFWRIRRCLGESVWALQHEKVGQSFGDE